MAEHSPEERLVVSSILTRGTKIELSGFEEARNARNIFCGVTPPSSAVGGVIGNLGVNGKKTNREGTRGCVKIFFVFVNVSADRLPISFTG